jgi:hypothetical protein
VTTSAQNEIIIKAVQNSNSTPTQVKKVTTTQVKEMKVREYVVDSDTDSSDYTVDEKKQSDSSEVYSATSGPDVDAIEQSVREEARQTELPTKAKTPEQDGQPQVAEKEEDNDKEAKISLEESILDDINKKIEEDEKSLSEKQIEITESDFKKSLDNVIVYEVSVVDANDERIEKGSAPLDWLDCFNWQKDLKNFSFVSILVAIMICFVIFTYFAYNASGTSLLIFCVYTYQFILN